MNILLHSISKKQIRVHVRCSISFHHIQNLKLRFKRRLENITFFQFSSILIFKKFRFFYTAWFRKKKPRTKCSLLRNRVYILLLVICVLNEMKKVFWVHHQINYMGHSFFSLALKFNLYCSWFLLVFGCLIVGLKLNLVTWTF